jgi:hypothetical protein
MGLSGAAPLIFTGEARQVSAPTTARRRGTASPFPAGSMSLLSSFDRCDGLLGRMWFSM